MAPEPPETPPDLSGDAFLDEDIRVWAASTSKAYEHLGAALTKVQAEGVPLERTAFYELGAMIRELEKAQRVYVRMVADRCGWQLENRPDPTIRPKYPLALRQRLAAE